MGCYLLPTKCSFQLLDCSVIGNSLRAILPVKCLREGKAAGVSMGKKIRQKEKPCFVITLQVHLKFPFYNLVECLR